MNSKLKLSIQIISLLLFSSVLKAQSSFYDINKIQKIYIEFSQSNWDYILDTNKYGEDKFILAQRVIINGVPIDSVGVKYKGSSSYDSTFKKNPLNIKLDKFKNHSYKGISDIKLANCYSDPSMIREVLAYSIANKYMHSPRSNFAMVYINNAYIGLYSNDEPVTESFCTDHFFSDSKNPTFKCSQLVASPYAKSSLKYISADSSDYFPRYEMETKYGWNDFVKLCDTVTNFQSRMPYVIDVDRFLWMFAFNNLLVNMDSYSGAFSQNYYVFKDNVNYYNPIPWDLNMSFGAFPYVGSQGGGLGTLTTTQMQNLTGLLHASDPDWPVLNYLLSNASYKKRYLAHLKTILNENITNAWYETTAASMIALIDSAVKIDSNKFFTYTQFQNALTTNIVSGSRTIPGLKLLMDGRKTYFASNDLTGTQPVITNVSTSVAHPIVATAFAITATIQNAANAWLYYRYNETVKFVSVPMYDDGLHNDGAANDKKYGANILMSAGICQYYVYAESNDAAALSPERAEYEFYTVMASVTKVNKGEIAINEFMASNVSAAKDAAGDYDDWVELYNNTSGYVDLTGWYLTDDYASRTKWKFTNGTTIAPNGYLVIWCDNQPTQAGLHSTFKLSNNGERLMLSQVDSSVVDSITYGVQKTDTSFARVPNGTGIFQFRFPSINARNDTPVIGLPIIKSFKSNAIIYPNPGKGMFYCNLDECLGVEVISSDGKSILQTQGKEIIDLNGYADGIYLFRVQLPDGMVVTRKVLKKSE